MKKRKSTMKVSAKGKTIKKKTIKKKAVGKKITKNKIVKKNNRREKIEKRAIKKNSKTTNIKKVIKSNTQKEFSKFHKLVLVLGFAILTFIFSILFYIYVSQILYLNLIFVFIFALFASRILAKQKKRSTICCSCSGCLIGVVSSILFLFVLLFIFLYDILIQDIFIYFVSALIIGSISCALGSRSRV